MKTIFLLFLLISSGLSFGQKQLMSITNIYYDETTGDVDEIDSTAYVYNSATQGALLEFKPIFDFIEEGFFYTLPIEKETFLIHSNESMSFFGSSYPLFASDTTQHTISAGNINESLSTSGERTLYTYNASGLMTQRLNQIFDGTTWVSNDSAVYTYDALGNMLTSKGYSFFFGSTFGRIDSMFYNTGTTIINEYVSYYNNNGVIDLSSKSEIVYSGSNVDYIDLYESNGSSGLDWFMRINYNYSNNEPSGLVGYEVLNNMLTTNIALKALFLKNTQNLLTEYTLIADGDTTKQIYSYDNDSYLIKQTNFYSDGLTGALYKESDSKYSYSFTTGIPEKEISDVMVYPNPASDFLIVKSDHKIKEIQIYNLSGQIVLEQSYLLDKIDIQNLIPGTHIIRGNAEDGSSFSKKILVN